MTFKELIEKLRGNSEEKDSLKDYVKELDKRTRAEKIVEDRSKSANLRELERIYKEQQDKQINQELEVMRKKRQEDIDFGHNPIHTKNVISKKKGDWEMLKERNLFSSQGNMFNNQKNIFIPKKRK